MDIGFGALLEKCEAYFGERATRLFVLLIVLCVALIIAAQAWKQALAPAVRLIFSIRFDDGFWNTVGAIGTLAGGVVFGVATASLITASFVRWKLARDAKADVAQAKQLLSDMKAYRVEMFAQTDDMLDRAHAVLAKADGIFRDSQESRDAIEELFERAKLSLKDGSEGQRD